MNFKILLTFLVIVSGCSTQSKKNNKSPTVDFFPRQFMTNRVFEYNFGAFLHKDLLVKRFGHQYGIRSTDYLSKEQELKFRKKITTEAIYNSLSIITRVVDAVDYGPRFNISNSYDCDQPTDHFSKVLNSVICNNKKSGSVYSGQINQIDDIDVEDLWKKLKDIKLMTFLKTESFDIKKDNSDEKKYQFSNLIYDLEDNAFVSQSGKLKEQEINYDTELSKTISVWSGSRFYINSWAFATEEDKPVLLNYDLAYYLSTHLPIINLQQCQTISASLIEKAKELMINDLISNPDALEPFISENYCNQIFGWQEDQKNEINKNVALNFSNLKYLWKIVLLNYAEISPSKKKIDDEDAVIINVKVDLPKMLKEIKVMKRTKFVKKG